MRFLSITWVLVCALGSAGSMTACGGGSSSGNPNATPPAPPAGSQFIVEQFLGTLNRDDAATDADWGVSEAGILKGLPVTTRNVYVYGYEDASTSTFSGGLGQYYQLADPLTGQDIGVLPATLPATNLGRRVIVSISDTKLGPRGTITGLAWGPHANRTSAATYPNVRLRAGLRDPNLAGTVGLDATVAGSYAGSPTLLYDGAYTVAANNDVGNTAGHPATAHVGGYPQAPGCQTVGAGWNSQLFSFTGWYPWPALTATFDWDPGDPGVANDSVLLLDMSVQEGDVHQDMRSWYAVTFPCSGILVAGWPEQMLQSTYEGTAANPPDNFGAGILNPSPTTLDTCITLSRRAAVAQSKFYAGAFGDDTDYGVPAISPATQSSGATIVVEFQGADSVLADGITIDTSAAFTGWVQDIDLCDGMQNIRFRITLNADLVTLQVARVDSITIGMTDSNP